MDEKTPKKNPTCTNDGGVGHFDQARTPALTESVRAKVGLILPQLLDAPVIRTTYGIRPGHLQGLQLSLEWINATQLLGRNYGHKGNGFSTAFACAIEMLRKLAQRQRSS